MYPFKPNIPQNIPLGINMVADLIDPTKGCWKENILNELFSVQDVEAI